MARTKDVFTAAQAAQILGISERRVRQLVSEGKLPGEKGDDNVVRIPQQAVNEERKRRRGSAGGTKAAAATGRTRRARQTQATAEQDGMDVDAIAEKVASVVGQRLEGQLEITQRAESLLRGELDEERARRMEIEARLSDSRAELADVTARLEEARRHAQALEGQLQQAQQRRGLFRRA
jgi:excisionase family DNA binding protein